MIIIHINGVLSSFLKKYRKPIDIVGIVSYNANITTKPTNTVGDRRKL